MMHCRKRKDRRTEPTSYQFGCITNDPGDVLVKHWPTIKANRDHLQLNIVPFENSEDKINHILQNIGE